MNRMRPGMPFIEKNMRFMNVSIGRLKRFTRIWAAAGARLTSAVLKAMEYSRIPYVEKPVSRLIMGTAVPEMENPETAEKLLDEIFEKGVNTFDTAVQYGMMEANLGVWVQKRNLRHKVVIITKGAYPNAWRNRLTAHDILSDIHDSFAKMETDYIDIYLLHRDDPGVPVDAIVDVLNQLRSEGKIKAFGGSNWSCERILDANEYAEKKSLIPFTVSSPHFSLAEQIQDPWGGGCLSISGAENEKVREWYAERNMPVFAYSSLARGLPSGKMKSSESADASRFFERPAVLGYCHPPKSRTAEKSLNIWREKSDTAPRKSLWLGFSSRT